MQSVSQTMETPKPSTMVLFTKREVAQSWRVTQRTIDRMISQGTIPFVKLPGGRTIRFRQDQIEALMTGSQVAK
jgi:excisionase family DNA binding protein